MARTIAIWVFGLLASSIAGNLIGNWLDTYRTGWGGLLGIPAGLFAFVCIRLWMSERREPKK
jgi:hypothetical protein